MSAQYSSEEKSYYDRLFNVIDKDQLGVLTGEACYAFLLTSTLPQATLGTIWSMVDSANNGYLTKDGWYRACRLIGWAQKGDTVSEEYATKQGPYPVFEGQTLPQSNLPPAQVTTSQVPPLNPSDKAQFTRLFVGAGPENGMLSATKAQGIFVKSSLPTETLAKAWNLADTQQRGALDLPDFIIGMYYLQHLMTGAIKDLPISLPPGLYEQASGGRSKPAPPPNPMVAQLTGNAPMRLSQQLTGQGAMQPQRTGQSIAAQSPTRQLTAPPPAASTFQSPFGGSSIPSNQSAWDVTPESKAASDRFFESLDTGRKGFIEGDVAVPFLMQSGLPETDLAQVWDLADIRKEGKLSRDEFAVAMFLINNKLAGKELPSSLSQSMIPPSLRNQNVVTPQNNAAKDLFDVFGDSPPAIAPVAVPQQSYFASPPSRTASVNVPPPPASIRSPVAPPSRLTSPPSVPTRGAAEVDAFGSTPFGSQPDLMGDESAPTPKPTIDYSSEIGNAQNSLTSTEKAVSDLQREKIGLEAESSASAAQLKELELRLSSVRAQHDTETRVVTDLRNRVSEQKENITKLKQTLIQNESELSALRAEKDEIEQALLRDKEEVRATSKRMTEVADETTSLKTLLEKLKKEARQQKGMVVISKKQVSTAELNKDAVQKEIDQAAASNNEQDDEEVLSSPAQTTSSLMSPFVRPASTTSLHQAAATPLPMTPQQALSPVATGANQRSNNPFERLGFSAKPTDRALSPPQGAFATSSSRTDDEQGISTLQAVTMGVGGIAAVGALAAGSIVGAAALGTGAAAVTVAEHLTHDGEDLRHSKQANSQSGEESSDDEAKTPPANQSRADPFGMNEQEPTPQVTPAANVTSDPFGLPVTEDREQEVQADFASGFEDGFGDDFSRPNPPAVSNLESSDLQSPPGRPVLPDNLAPASQTAEDFEEALNEPAGLIGAIPTALRPDLESQGRTFSTEVFAPDSIVQTPETELPPSTPMSTESTAVPVDVKALQPSQAGQDGIRSTHEDSSDEEDEPEDLDRARSPYDARNSTGLSTSTSTLSGERDQYPGSHFEQPSNTEAVQKARALETPDMYTQTASYGDVPRSQSPPSEQLQGFGLGAPVDTNTIPHAAPAAFGADDAFDSFTSQATCSSGTQRRREPPPPPTTQKSISGSNPFGQMPTSTPAVNAYSGTTPVAGAQSSSSAFDDDFDFDDLQPAQIAAGGLAPPVATQFTSKVTTDFDDEFDDFSPDFEMINKPVSQSNTAVPLNDNFTSNGQGAPQIPAFESQTGFGNVNPGTSSGFSFEDDFMDRTDATPNNNIAPVTGLDHSAAPAPLMKAPAQPERPALPQRQTVGMTKAQPDDLADVKKLCNMGFDRNLVIDALEGADYNFDKALNFLLPGA